MLQVFTETGTLLAARCLACAVFLDNIEIEPGDVIDITHRLDNMSGFKVEVVKMLHNLGSAQKGVIDHIELVCVENGAKN